MRFRFASAAFAAGLSAALSIAAPAASAQTAPLNPRVALKVGAIGAVSDAGIFIAQEKGYFRDEGLDVEIVGFKAAPADSAGDRDRRGAGQRLGGDARPVQCVRARHHHEAGGRQGPGRAGIRLCRHRHPQRPRGHRPRLQGSEGPQVRRHGQGRLQHHPARKGARTRRNRAQRGRADRARIARDGCGARQQGDRRRHAAGAVHHLRDRPQCRYPLEGDGGFPPLHRPERSDHLFPEIRPGAAGGRQAMDGGISQRARAPISSPSPTGPIATASMRSLPSTPRSRILPCLPRSRPPASIPTDEWRSRASKPIRTGSSNSACSRDAPTSARSSTINTWITRWRGWASAERTRASLIGSLGPPPHFTKLYVVHTDEQTPSPNVPLPGIPARGAHDG